MSDAGKLDYYEILQVSANAEPDTIHRIYRLAGAAFSSRQSGKRQLGPLPPDSRGVHVLSDPERRAKYDVSYHQMRQDRWRLVSSGAQFGKRLRDRADRTADAARGALHPAPHGADGALAHDERPRDAHRPAARAPGLHGLVPGAEEVRHARRPGPPADHRRWRGVSRGELPRQPAAPPAAGADEN